MNSIITPADAVVLSLIFTRLIALFMSFPFFNTPLLPHNVKVLLVVSLSFFIMKNMHITYSLEHFSVWLWVTLIFKELLIGFGLGLLANFIISAFSYAAEIISYFMGLTVANIFDPTYGQVSVVSKFFLFLFYMLFFTTDAYSYFFATLFASFTYYPVTISDFNGGFWRYIIENGALLFTLAFQLAFPFALILYTINLALALVNRLIPQINVFIVGLPVQIFVGLAALAAGASLLVISGIDFIQHIGKDILYVIKHLG